MITLIRSEVDPKWVEVKENERVIEEVEVPFRLYRIPRDFSSVEEALRWLFDIEKKLVKGRAYRLLAARSYSSAALLQKLIEKGYRESICREMIDELQRLGYLQDESFLLQLIEREFRRGYGPLYIEMKVKSKGLDPERVRILLTDARQLAMIRQLSAKLSRHSSQKKIQMLARRGFDLSLLLSEIESSFGR
ncbi:MAG: regulatory protein RecX [Verrucomicrobiota bacterium]|nr:regulatory protein RecX [Verrucomicrobiota bacterium]